MLSFKRMRFAPDITVTAVRWYVCVAVVSCGKPNGDDPEPCCDTEPPEGSPCQLYGGGFGTKQAECYDVDVPLNWNERDGSKLSLFVKRAPASRQPRGQMWFLQGGPGTSSEPIERQMAAVQRNHPDIEVFTLDHRGVGRSAGLQCPEAAPNGVLVDVNAAACAAEAEEGFGAGSLASFSVTQAARDLDHLMGLFVRDGEQLFVWATSYGTYWAMRQMLVGETSVDGVILEGVMPGPETDFPADGPTEQKLLDMLELCRIDAFCGGKLPDPVATLTFLNEHWGVDHCTELADAGVTWRHMRELFMGLSRDRFGQIMVAPVLYRMERCSTADRTALVRASGNSKGRSAYASDGDGDGASLPLHFNIATSELFERGESTIAELLEQQEQFLIAPTVRAYYAGLHDAWPRYSEPLRDVWPTPAYPVLLLAGALDPITPVEGARLAAQHFDHATLVEIPWASHGVLLASPSTVGSGHCAYDVASAFLRDPTAPVPLDCLDNILPYNWESQDYNGRDIVQLVAQALMGVADPWED